jgi:hypothetical protein
MPTTGGPANLAAVRGGNGSTRGTERNASSRRSMSAPGRSSRSSPTRKGKDLRRFMRQVAAQYPHGQVHVIWDNLNIHFDGPTRRVDPNVTVQRQRDPRAPALRSRGAQNRLVHHRSR